MTGSSNCIEIGLVNNMPDAALEATECQFRALLDAASDGGLHVDLKLYALPDVPRLEFGQRHIDSFYTDVSDLWEDRLDGMIVTGTEPKATCLRDEPYWGTLTRLMEWAEERTHSTVWSCLAAHAAVLHLDGIGRRPLPDKRFGVFECARVAEHALTAAAPPGLRMPHSRWNDLSEDALVAAGYGVLMRSEAGVDAFVKHRKSLFVFFQGHPEYEADTLLLEYLRDIKRFLSRERDSYPTMPRGYFGQDTSDQLTRLQERAQSDRREELIEDFRTAHVAGTVANTWRPAAASVYRSWLQYLRAQKDRA